MGAKEQGILPQIVTADSVASTLRISRSTVYALVKDRELPAISIGRALRFDLQDVANFINSRRTRGILTKARVER